MPDVHIRPLTPDTWPDFAALVERHGGVWGGCWCLAFHAEGASPGPHRQEQKACRVRAGTAHAALVYHQAQCVGWAQYGPPDELPRIKHRRAYEQGQPAGQAPPDWRITCLFVDKAWRGQGVSLAAVQGALALIAAAGGGRVESYPQDTAGTRTSPGFLHNGTVAVFEAAGFVRERAIGQHHWVVRRDVAPENGPVDPADFGPQDRGR